VESAEYHVIRLSFSRLPHREQLFWTGVALHGSFQQFDLFHFADNAVELFLSDCGHPVFKVLRGFGPRDDMDISALSIPESPKVLAIRVRYKADETSPEFHAPDYRSTCRGLLARPRIPSQNFSRRLTGEVEASTHISGNRVYQDLRISSGLPVTRAES